jgi:competence protein ComEC
LVRQHPQNERPRARAKVWGPTADTTRRPAGLLLPDGIVDAAGSLRGLPSEWIAAEVAPGRLMPWLPVAFGFGIVAYFSADREPAWWAATALAMAGLAITALARHRPIGFPIVLGLTAIAAGFATATLQTVRIAHPILRSPASGALVSGFVEVREERERSDRIVVRVQAIESSPAAPTPERVRVAVRKGSAPAVGSFVEFKARLSPPMQSLRPDGYDFARDMYFQRIGASGYALGAIKAKAPPVQGGFWLSYATIVDDIREAIDKRIRSVIAGDNGAIASALLTGKRDAISTPVNDAMYVSSLAHVLSISGYHMAVVSGIAFFFIRAALALFPVLASRFPIKKWAALGAFVAAAFYLLLSGAEVATQRSFIMIAIVLIGVMLDRPTLTFRTLAVAAIGVLIFAPQAVIHPSFQMSFAATLALVAAYQYGLPWRAGKDSSLGTRVALWGAREVFGLLLASLVAGFATTPYAAYHFHRLAPYGAVANLLAMPVVSALVMPMGILGLLAMPFGFDAPFWRLMSAGIDWMNGVALWVTSLPGAVGRLHAFGTGPLLAGTAGILLVCLLRTPLRWSGAVLVAGGSLWAVVSPQPDVLISGDGQSAAFRGTDGRLAILHNGRDTFAVKEWLAADADARAPKDSSLANGVRCDAVGCIGTLSDGRLISLVIGIEAVAEDCTRAAIIVSAREVPASDCAAMVVDRQTSREHGAVALRKIGDHFQPALARPPGSERPWTANPTRASESAQAAAPAGALDAMPREDDLSGDD